MKVTSFDVFLDVGSKSPHIISGKNAFLRSEKLPAKIV